MTKEIELTLEEAILHNMDLLINHTEQAFSAFSVTNLIRNDVSSCKYTLTDTIDKDWVAHREVRKCFDSIIDVLREDYDIEKDYQTTGDNSYRVFTFTKKEVKSLDTDPAKSLDTLFDEVEKTVGGNDDSKYAPKMDIMIGKTVEDITPQPKKPFLARLFGGGK